MAAAWWQLRYERPGIGAHGVLRVLGTNGPARDLYLSLGFVVEGVLHEEFRLDGRYVDDVLTALSLA